MENNIRSGNMLVRMNKRSKSFGLVEEIMCELSRLEVIYRNPRVKRQYEDGIRFIEMISKAPYVNCRTVSNLQKEISKQRDALKQELINIDSYMPGHQLSIFEVVDEISEQEKQELELKIINLKEEIRWLHKCLGICKNRRYFK